MITRVTILTMINDVYKSLGSQAQALLVDIIADTVDRRNPAPLWMVEPL